MNPALTKAAWVLAVVGMLIAAIGGDASRWAGFAGGTMIVLAIWLENQ